jgi:hypothetical protein
MYGNFSGGFNGNAAQNTYNPYIQAQAQQWALPQQQANFPECAPEPQGPEAPLWALLAAPMRGGRGAAWGVGVTRCAAILRQLFS